MSKYFSLLPTIQYNISNDVDNDSFVDVTDIFVRQKLTEAVKENAAVYYPYIIQDKERPDILAFNYYGDVKYTWLIFFANDIVDPYYQWPMDEKQFNSYIINKYNSISEAKTTIHEYRQIIRENNYTQSKYTISIDKDTYDSLPSTSREAIYKFDYEDELNESKREIQLIEDVYVASIYNEVRRTFLNAWSKW